MDYRRFLGKTDARVLPYFGGPSVEAEDRRLRVDPFELPGWYRFQIEGRNATKLGPADPPPLDALPKVSGWFLDGALVREGAVIEPIALMPAEQPARFAKLSTRRWRSGELLFAEVDFETEVEGAVREALADGQGLKAVKGVPAPLRAAFAYAVTAEASRKTQIRFAPAEVRGKLLAIAEGGVPEAEAALRALAAEREVARREMEELRRRHAVAAAQVEVQREREVRIAQAQANQQRAEDRAADALEAAGGRLETARALGGGQLEVVFRFMAHRFIAIVDAATLQVIDSGICLGHPPRDDLVTLESLPSVIKEAIDTEALVILRWP